jgi:hypothetical protein
MTKYTLRIIFLLAHIGYTSAFNPILAPCLQFTNRGFS